MFDRVRQAEKTPYVPFDDSSFPDLFNVNRRHGVTVKDAMVNPFQTIVRHYDKDPVQPDLGKRNALKQGLFDKVSYDVRGKPFIKVDTQKEDTLETRNGVIY